MIKILTKIVVTSKHINFFVGISTFCAANKKKRIVRYVEYEEIRYFIYAAESDLNMKFTYDANDEKILERSEGRCCIPKRYVFVLLGFLGFFNLFAARVCLSVSMVVMVNRSIVSHPNNIQVVSECPDLIHNNESETVTTKGEKYNWDANTQGLILGAIYYGMLLTLIPGAVLSEKFGAKWFFGGPVFFSTMLTFLIPIAASSGVVPLIILRVLQGFAEGLTFPAINMMIAKWSHILERSRFVSLIYIGIHLGNIVSPIVTGWFCTMDILGGWPLTFYVFGISGYIWFIFWSIFVYETPGTHRNISTKELQYLEGSKEISNKKMATPWKAIFTSFPVWVAVFANVSNELGFVIFMTEIPMYLSTALHFGVLNVGMLSALGFTVKSIVAWFASYYADLLRQWDSLSITNIRKLFTAIALFGPAVCLLGVTLSGCYLQLITGLVILSTAMSGFFYAGVGTVHIDLSPIFAGTLLAIIDVFGTITGIIGPSIVGALTLHMTTVSQWNWVFCIVAVFQVISGLIFTAFGSAELQSWGKSDSYLSSKAEKPKLNSSEDGIISKIRTFASLLPESATKAETNN